MKKALGFTRKFLFVFAKMLIMTVPIWGAIFMGIVVLSWIFARAEQIEFGDSLYFACVTALTIGYGDIVPVTGTGKVLSVFMGVLGVITTGIVVAVALQATRIAYETLIENAGGILDRIKRR